MDTWNEGEFRAPDDDLEREDRPSPFYDWLPSETSFSNTIGNIVKFSDEEAYYASNCTDINLDVMCSEREISISTSDNSTDAPEQVAGVANDFTVACVDDWKLVPIKVSNSPEILPSYEKVMGISEDKADEIEPSTVGNISLLEVQVQQIIEATASSTDAIFQFSGRVETQELGSEQSSSDMCIESGSSHSSKESLKKRARRKFVPSEAKNEDYWAKRKKNNEAARRSRAIAKEKQRKTRLESMITRSADLKSRYIALCIEREKLKCDAILLGVDLDKL